MFIEVSQIFLASFGYFLKKYLIFIMKKKTIIFQNLNYLKNKRFSNPKQPKIKGNKNDLILAENTSSSEISCWIVSLESNIN